MARQWYSTAGRARAVLQRLIGEMAAERPAPDGDRLLAELCAAHRLAEELRIEMNRMIVAARNRRPPTPWRRIGQALGTGQPAGRRVRVRELPAERPEARIGRAGAVDREPLNRPTIRAMTKSGIRT